MTISAMWTAHRRRLAGISRTNEFTPRHRWRFIVMATVVAAVGVDSALSGTPDEFTTAPNAILCLSRDSLGAANDSALLKGPAALRAMGCFRSGSGIRARLMENPEEGGPWRVRIYPAGMSGGVLLWGLPSAFTAPNGEKIATAQPS